MERTSSKQQHMHSVGPGFLKGAWSRQNSEIEYISLSALESWCLRKGEWSVPAPEFTATQPEVADWSEGMQVPSLTIQQFPTEDWSAQPATEHWSAAPMAQATEWMKSPEMVTILDGQGHFQRSNLPAVSRLLRAAIFLRPHGRRALLD
ncbi:hypothetical protein GH733_000486 [Mirounga leonina]|nr:hypothetical protein GH733_000486 [Mirounga leonina]